MPPSANDLVLVIGPPIGITILRDTCWNERGLKASEEISDARVGQSGRGGAASLCTSRTLKQSSSLRRFGIHDPGLEPFAESRPAVTKMAKEKGEALGIKVNRRRPAAAAHCRPVLLLAARERARDSAGSLLVGEQYAQQRPPLEEKMALFWHGHFAVNRSQSARLPAKRLGQLQLFQKYGVGNS